MSAFDKVEPGLRLEVLRERASDDSGTTEWIREPGESYTPVAAIDARVAGSGLAAAMVEAFNTEQERRSDQQAQYLGWLVKLVRKGETVAGAYHVLSRLFDGFATLVSHQQAEAAVGAPGAFPPEPSVICASDSYVLCYPGVPDEWVVKPEDAPEPPPHRFGVPPGTSNIMSDRPHPPIRVPGADHSDTDRLPHDVCRACCGSKKQASDVQGDGMVIGTCDWCGGTGLDSDGVKRHPDHVVTPYEPAARAELESELETPESDPSAACEQCDDRGYVIIGLIRVVCASCRGS